MDLRQFLLKAVVCNMKSLKVKYKTNAAAMEALYANSHPLGGPHIHWRCDSNPGHFRSYSTQLKSLVSSTDREKLVHDEIGCSDKSTDIHG